MDFRLSMRRARKSRRHDTRYFTISRLWRCEGGSQTDISNLLDRTYRYHSLRELAWHLAERFAVPVKEVTIERAA